MQNERWQRIKDLFAAAAALPPEEREGYLAAQESDPEILAEVRSLLAAHAPTLAPAGAPATHKEGPGSRIGPYKLLEVIGEGGYGTVYAAEQEAPVRRRVALKIVKAGMDSREVVARFEQERQALALMDHPNIARVFDGGATPSGRPFFVMELVKGDPITEYCDREKLTTAERLRLFVDVGRAVQHAHTKGVIHRDLKPSNVLVTLVDGKAIAKVIDFGVAKATQGRLTDKTLFTEHKQMIGTPLYMSPEQAHISGVDVDTRSDVYSLGVVLYELLTGTTPFRKEELLDAGLAEMHRVLREVEPPKPSTRVATLGKTSGAVAAQRRVEVAKWNAMLRGDLDWIVMKCLEKERARRYETASALVQDVERHLGGEAVLAAPASVGYRLQKFARRRKGLVAAVAAILLTALTAGLLIVFILQAKAGEARQAAREQEQLRQIADNRRIEAEKQSYLGNIVAADAAMERGDFEVAVERLKACPEHLRKLEWRYLNAKSDSSLVTIPYPDAVKARQETWPFRSIDISPDGHQILASLADGTARTYDIVDGHETMAFRGHGGGIWEAKFIQGGTQVLTASVDQTARLWDAKTGTELSSFPHSGVLETVIYVADGNLVITSGHHNDDGIVEFLPTVWDASRKAHLFTLGTAGTKYDAAAVASTPEGSRIVTGNKLGHVEVWNPKTGARLDDIAALDGPIDRLIVSPDGRYAAAGSNYGGTSDTLVVCDLQAGRLVATLPAGTGRELAAFAPDGRTLIASSNESSGPTEGAAGEVTWRFEVGSWTPIEPLGYAGCSFRRPFDATGTILVTQSRGAIHVWNLDGSQKVTSLEGAGAFDAIVSPDGSRIITRGKVIQVWDAAMAPRVQTLGAEDLDNTEYCRLSPTGDVVVTGGEPVRIWDTSTATPIATLAEGPDLAAVAFSPDGEVLATAGGDNVARLWSTNTGEPLGVAEGHAARVTDVAFSPIDGRLFTASRDGTARAWETGVHSRQVIPGVVFGRHDGPVQAIAISNDGHRIATASSDRTACVWDTASGVRICRMDGHTAGLTVVAFSADGHCLATATGEQNNAGDGSVRIWDATSGELLREIPHERGACRMQFSQDGGLLLTASWTSGSTVQTWDSRTGVPLATLPSGLHPDATLCADGSRTIGPAERGEAWILDPVSTQEILAIRGVNGGWSKYGAQVSVDQTLVALGSNGERGSLVNLAPYRERFRRTSAIRSALVRMSERVRAQTSEGKTLAEARTAVLRDPALSRDERRATCMCVTAIERKDDTDAYSLVQRVEKAMDFPGVATMTREEQVDAAHRATELAPTRARTHRVYGKTLYRTEHFEQAATEFEASAAISKEHGDYREREDWALAVVARSRLGQLQQAKAALDNARRLTGDQQDPDLARAEAEFRRAFPQER